MNHCRDCKHWDADPNIKRTVRMRACELISSFMYSEQDYEGLGQESQPPIEFSLGTLAATCDGEAYYSALLTSEDFGCVLFQTKETPRNADQWIKSTGRQPGLLTYESVQGWIFCLDDAMVKPNDLPRWLFECLEAPSLDKGTYTAYYPSAREAMDQLTVAYDRAVAEGWKPPTPQEGKA